jgi:acyl-coenzyme A thioesterase PaaI-like protein
MGTPEAGKLFLESLTGSNLTDIDLEDAPVFDTVALNTIRDIQAFPGRLTCIIPVEQRVQNRYGTLHGGCIGGTFIFD